MAMIPKVAASILMIPVLYYVLMFMILCKVKVACPSMTTTDCSYRAITMLLIVVEVSVKVACPSMTTTDCSYRAITMLLILVEVFVKVACRSVT